MSMVAPQIDSKGHDLLAHPLIRSFELKLGDLIGVLSKFIITKQCRKVMSESQHVLNRSNALKILKGIVEEASYLIGDIRASMLKEDLIKITDEHFKEEATHER